MKRLFRLVLFWSFFASLCWVHARNGWAQESVLLRYAFQPNQELKYTLDQVTKTELKVKGQTGSQSDRKVVTIVWSIERVDPNGQARMTQTIQRIQYYKELRTPDGSLNFEYDSATNKRLTDPKDEIMNRQFDAMINTPYRLTMDPLGTIADIHIPSIVKQLMPENRDPSQPPEVQNFLKSGIVLPQQPLRVGEFWTQRLENENAELRQVQVVTNTYDGNLQHGGMNLVKIKRKLEMTMQSKDVIPFELAENQGDGIIFFNNVDGYLLESHLIQKLKMLMPDIEQVVEIKTTLTRQF